jgi:hypothetical protein
VADPVRRRPVGVRRLRAERKAEIRDPDRVVPIDCDPPWNGQAAAGKRCDDMRLATGVTLTTRRRALRIAGRLSPVKGCDN